jgi:hypothetical protein
MKNFPALEKSSRFVGSFLFSSRKTRAQPPSPPSVCPIVLNTKLKFQSEKTSANFLKKITPPALAASDAFEFYKNRLTF